MSDPYGGDQEERNKTLKVQLREIIREVHNDEIFSEEWKLLTPKLYEFAEIAFAEYVRPIRFVGKKEVKDILGKKTEGTMWDSKQGNLAIRIFLEEGKLNLSMRMLVHFKKLQREENNFKNSTETNKKLAFQFEKSLGVILYLAMQHIEVLQIIDIPMTLEHCAETLTHLQANPPESSSLLEFVEKFQGEDKFQETLVFGYLDSITTHFEEMEKEDEFMAKMEELKMIPLVAKTGTTFMEGISNTTFKHILRFLSNCFNAEVFQGNEAKFLGESAPFLFRLLPVANALLYDNVLTKEEISSFFKTVKSVE